MTDAVPIQNAWKFCPSCGLKAETTGNHPFNCSQCGYTHYFSPNAAVGALIVDSDESMLFIVRAKDPGKGKLGLPGGFVDAGETAEVALVREIEEELSLQIDKYRYLASFPNRYTFKGTTSPVIDFFFVATVETFAGIAAQPGEIDGWTFLPPKQVAVEDLAFETHRMALEAYMRKKGSGVFLGPDSNTD